MRRFLFTIVVVAVAGAVTWRLLVTAAPQSGQRPTGKPPIAVECEAATTGDIDDVAEFTGTLAGKAEVLVSPKIAGRIESVLVDLGDQVAEGQLLATLEDAEANHTVDEAKARLAVARATLEECEANLATAQQELDRVRTLRERKVAAASELEAAEAEVSALLARRKVAEASIHQQEAALRAAETRLAYTEIYAPISGFVGKRFLDEGAMVSLTTSILSLADISTVKTVIGVVERDYAKIRVGLGAMLTVDTYPDKVFEGRVSRIAPVLDPDTRTAETEIEVANPDLMLKPGMFTRVRIHFGTHRNVTLIPLRALVKRDMEEGDFIPVENNTKAAFVPVKVGLSSEESVEVSGVEPGQQIIVMGQHLLSDGDVIVLNTEDRSRPS